MSCELCASPGGEIVWQDDRCRVVWVNDPNYPAFCRVIWAAHVKEMTDLAPAERIHLMSVVFAVEEAVRDTVAPDKINLASLGNIVPHLHWHVIPRFRDDRHFPHAIWAAAAREGRTATHPGLVESLRMSLLSGLANLASSSRC
ncbi:MAG: HIT family protein [Burkholderiales bacterium]